MNLAERHSVFLLRYHIVLVVKHRKKVITRRIAKRLREIFVEVGKRYRVVLEEWNFGEYYIHAFFRARPETCPGKFATTYKSQSARTIRKEFPEVERALKEGFWAKSYCLFTSAGASVDIVKEYVENRKLD